MGKSKGSVIYAYIKNRRAADTIQCIELIMDTIH